MNSVSQKQLQSTAQLSKKRKGKNTLKQTLQLQRQGTRAFTVLQMPKRLNELSSNNCRIYFLLCFQ